MQIDPYILTFSAATVIVTIWMGFWSARRSKTTSDFFVAGRSVSVGWNASAISGEYLSAASFMGVAGMVMSSGYDALWYPVCYACGYLFLLLFIAGPLRRFGAYTIPDFAEGRFDSPVFRKIAVVFVLFIGFFYTMPQMKGAGTTLAYIFPGLPYWAGVVLVGAVITLNVALGGMKGITLVQAFQYWAKMFAISVPIFVLMAVHGHYGKQVGMNVQRPTSNIQRSTNATASLDVGRSTLDVERSPLPPKAPADSTWLNPFGPLTTKAAKAAKPQVNYSGEFDRNELRSQPTTKANFWSRLKNHWIPVQQSTPAEEVTITQAAERFAIARSFADSRFEWERSMLVQVAPSLKSTKLQLPAMATKSADDRANQLLAVLNTNGVTVLQEPGNSFKVFPTKDAVIVPVDTRPFALLYTYSLIIALVCGTAGLPHILVRFYTNPDGVAAKRTTMWVMILIGVFYLFPPVFGVMGRNLLPELYAGAGAKGTDKVVLELPRVVSQSGSESAGQKPGVTRPTQSPADSLAHLLPWGSILSGITCAGAFAAFMSTFSGLLVSMTGAMAHDVYGRILNPKATPQQRLRAFKIAAVGIGAVAILLGTQVEPLQINFMVGQAFAIAAASYFPLLFVSVWWRKLTMKGAATGMLAGGTLALAGISLTSFSDLKWLPLEAFWAAHPLLRILCEQPAIWTVPLAIALMVVISKLTQKDVPADVRMKMLVLHAPEKLGLKQEYIQEHQHGH